MAGEVTASNSAPADMVTIGMCIEGPPKVLVETD